MKVNKTPARRLRKGLLLLATLVVFTIACGSNDLSRSEAEKSIREANDFKIPFQIEYTQGDAKYNEGLLEVISDDETKEQATARKIKQYLELNPQVAVLNHYGMILPQVVPREEKPPKRVYYSNPAFWHFQEKYTGSDKANEYWQEAGILPNSAAFPLARREFVGVTGITKQGENQAIVEFGWKWQPNQIGKAFDNTTDEFKSLPPDLQRQLTGEKIPAGESRRRDWRIDWKAEKCGQGLFQKYDDGWRLVRISGL